ncbi:MAG: hypothetical protein ACOYW7_10710 [Nitrospirota bacterium]
MKKKVAVIVTDRQQEALRMAVGLTLADNQITVFVMDRRLEIDEGVAMSIEALREMKATIITNTPENNFEQMSTEEIARALVEYDAVIPY